MQAKTPEDRERLLALLRDQHRYPGTHRFQIVVRNDEERIDSVLRVLMAAATSDGPDVRHERVPSRAGTYVSLRVIVPVGAAEEVLDMYQLLGELDGLLSYF